MIRLDDVRNTIIQGSALESLKTFPSACVDEIVTSPPYWPLRSYLPKNHPDKGKEIGGETTLDEYLVHLWQITDELYRILKPTGTMFINFGDSYAGSSQGSWNAPIEIRGKQYRKSLNLDEEYLGGPRRDKTLADRSLCFQNYKFALGLMDIDYRIIVEWRVLGKPAGRIEEMMKHPRIQLITRNLLIWKKCLSYDTKLLVKGHKGLESITIKDLFHSQWRGKCLLSQDRKGNDIWVKVKDIIPIGRKKGLRITTKAGRIIKCSYDHKFPFQNSNYPRGGIRYRKVKLCEAQNLKISDYLYLNEKISDKIIDAGTYKDYLEGYVVGFFLAEGSYTKREVGVYKDTVFSKSAQKRWGRQKQKIKKVEIMLSCGTKDIERGYISNIEKLYSIRKYIYGNHLHIRSTDKNFLKLLDDYVEGENAYEKHLRNKAFNQSKKFMEGIIDGFLNGDGCWDKENNRWRVGICPNMNLKDNLMLLCRFLGYNFRYESLREVAYTYKGIIKKSSAMRFSIRKENNRKRNFGCITDRIDTIEEIETEFYDIELEPVYQIKRRKSDYYVNKMNKLNNLYFLANGIWTHNSNSMPFSGTSRFQNTYEPIYFFVKSDTPQYYYNERTKLITKTKPKGKVEGADWEWIKCPYCEGTGKSTINIGRWDKQHDKIYGEDIGNRSRVREGIANADIRYKAGDKPCFRCKTTGRIVRSLWHSEKYFFNLNDIRRQHQDVSLKRLRYGWDGHREPGSSWEGMDIKKMCHPLGANPGDVMTVATKGSSIGHYATFPEQLISPLIIAGSPDKVCAKCGLPVVQVVELSHPGKTQFQGKYSEQDEIQGGLTTKGSFGRIVGKTHCSCELPEYERAIVLDPFMGSGTTAIVAKKLGRDYIGIELNDGYVKMSRDRLNQIEESLF